MKFILNLCIYFITPSLINLRKHFLYNLPNLFLLLYNFPTATSFFSLAKNNQTKENTKTEPKTEHQPETKTLTTSV